MHRSMLTLAMAFVVIHFFPAPSPAAGTAWQGKEITRDGALHVMNPADPMERPVTLRPEKRWEIGGDEDADVIFGVLSRIATDDAGNVYLLDSQLNEVFVFSPDGEYLRSIGREGQGPGEFNRPADLFITTRGEVAVMQRMPGKIVLLTPDGEPAGAYPVPEPDGGGMQMFSGARRAGDRIVISVQQFARRDDGFEITQILMSVGADGKRIATFFTRSDKRDFARLSFDEKTFGRNALVWAVGADGRVYGSADFDAYRIEVWNVDGTLARVIERAYTHRERTQKEMERNKPRVRFRRNDRTQRPEVKVSKTDRDVLEIFPRPDGTLWVLTSYGAFDAPEGAIATFDVFDEHGRFARQVTLSGTGDYVDDGLHVVGGRFFVVRGLRSAQRAASGGGDEEDDGIDAEPMAVACYGLGAPVQTRK